jgi:hypothetical protein
MGSSHVAKIFICLGLFFLFAGLLFIVFERFHLFGKLPGDIVVKGTRVTLFFPLTISILLSIILTIIVNIVIRR